jgi:hypothetical protein
MERSTYICKTRSYTPKLSQYAQIACITSPILDKCSYVSWGRVKKTITIRRISSLSLLKLLSLGGAVFWVLYVLLSFLYLLIGGDLHLPYTVGDVGEITSSTNGAKIFLLLAFFVAVFDFLFLFGFWLVVILGLWIYSKFKPIKISYYESETET